MLINDRSSAGQGIALIAVMWALLILSIMAAIITATIKSNSLITKSAVTRLQMYYASEGAVALAISDLANRGHSFWARSQNYSRVFIVSNFRVRVEASRETGLIDFNRADPQLIEALFLFAGADGELARSLGDAIADWRDSDDIKRPRGAESLDYRSFGFSGRPRNAPFQTLGEIRRVAGLTDRLYRCVLPLITIYSNSSEIFTGSASPSMLEVLQIYENNKSNTSGPNQLSRSSLLAGNAVRLQTSIEGTIGRNYYLIRIVRFTGDRQNPYLVLSSNENPLKANSNPNSCNR